MYLIYLMHLIDLIYLIHLTYLVPGMSDACYGDLINGIYQIYLTYPLRDFLYDTIQPTVVPVDIINRYR